MRTIKVAAVVVFAAVALLLVNLDTPTLPETAQATGAAIDRSAGFNENAEAVPGELIVGFASSAAGASDREATITAAGATLERHLLLPGYSLISVEPGAEGEYAEGLLAEPGVVSVEPNLIRQPLFDPNDEAYAAQWHFPKIGLPSAWDKTMGGGVTVAVIDGGIAYEDCSAAVCGDDFFVAPDFGGTAFVSPWDFIDGDAHPNDEDGHGTHVASTVAEATDNVTGAAGVAPAASLMPIRVCDADGCPISAEIDGIAWAASNGADVINLSIGAFLDSVAERQAIDDAIAQGLVIVAAAANGGEDGIGDPFVDCPACYPGVISVAATRFDQALAPYSNYGEGVFGATLTLAAPGGDVTVDQNGDTFPDGVLQQTFDHACGGKTVDFSAFVYCFFQGTSMASPHVAGVAALVLSINPALTPGQVRDILTSTATDLGDPGYDLFYGFGEINAASAVAAAQDSLLNTCPPAVSSGRTFADALVTLLPIPDDDAAGTEDCFIISDGEIIEDLDVGLDISHTWVGDLIVTLTHEDTGTSVTLLDRPGAPQSPIGCSGDDISATLSDEAAVAGEDKCNGGIPTISGYLRPTGLLSAFDGESSAGTWTLLVSDNVGLDEGALNGWSITIAPTKQPEPGDTDGDGCSDERENGPDQFQGGRRNYLYEWDYYDVNGDGVVNIPGDILPVAQAFGSGDPDYTPQKDRSPGPPPGVDPLDPANNERWDLGPPDGVINIPDDILGVAAQFGHRCAPLP